jgi:predicted Rossmann-fold nucleotide-binding protein
MAKIVVAGGLVAEEADPKNDARAQFVKALGREIISRGHVVLGGCRTELDAVVASAAAEMCTEKNRDPKKLIRSWVTQKPPSHDKGEITRSRVDDWSLVPRGYDFPEPIREADAVVIVGGWTGTQYAASWARLANKPIVPVATFGHAAAEIFNDELQNFDRRYANRISRDDYEILDRVITLPTTATWVEGFAKDIISLTEKLISSRDVFIIMSFAEKAHLLDAYDTFCTVCKDNDFSGFRVDDHIDHNQRIVPTVLDSIRRSAFIIADVSEPRPNVYYELGFAQALGKGVITTAYKGTQLPFDIFDVPTLYWDSQRALREELDKRIKIVRKT